MMMIDDDDDEDDDDEYDDDDDDDASAAADDDEDDDEDDDDDDDYGDEEEHDERVDCDDLIPIICLKKVARPRAREKSSLFWLFSCSFVLQNNDCCWVVELPPFFHWLKGF